MSDGKATDGVAEAQQQADSGPATPATPTPTPPPPTPRARKPTQAEGAAIILTHQRTLPDAPGVYRMLDAKGTPLGLELILPDWFFAGVMDAALVLTIDPAYFRLTGGIERWLYRLVRKHGGRQPGGWQFDFRHLHRKSGSTAKPYDFACDLRALVARQSLPGYVLGIERLDGAELLTFRPVPQTARG